jgi:hypothetical protein
MGWASGANDWRTSLQAELHDERAVARFLHRATLNFAIC